MREKVQGYLSQLDLGLKHEISFAVKDLSVEKLTNVRVKAEQMGNEEDFHVQLKEKVSNDLAMVRKRIPVTVEADECLAVSEMVGKLFRVKAFLNDPSIMRDIEAAENAVAQRVVNIVKSTSSFKNISMAESAFNHLSDNVQPLFIELQQHHAAQQAEKFGDDIGSFAVPCQLLVDKRSASGKGLSHDSFPDLKSDAAFVLVAAPVAKHVAPQRVVRGGALGSTTNAGQSRSHPTQSTVVYGATQPTKLPPHGGAPGYSAAQGTSKHLYQNLPSNQQRHQAQGKQTTIKPKAGVFSKLNPFSTTGPPSSKNVKQSVNQATAQNLVPRKGSTPVKTSTSQGAMLGGAGRAGKRTPTSAPPPKGTGRTGRTPKQVPPSKEGVNRGHMNSQAAHHRKPTFSSPSSMSNRNPGCSLVYVKRSTNTFIALTAAPEDLASLWKQYAATPTSPGTVTLSDEQLAAIESIGSFHHIALDFEQVVRNPPNVLAGHIQEQLGEEGAAKWIQKLDKLIVNSIQLLFSQVKPGDSAGPVVQGVFDAVKSVQGQLTDGSLGQLRVPIHDYGLAIEEEKKAQSRRLDETQNIDDLKDFVKLFGEYARARHVDTPAFAAKLNGFIHQHVQGYEAQLKGSQPHKALEGIATSLQDWKRYGMFIEDYNRSCWHFYKKIPTTSMNKPYALLDQIAGVFVSSCRTLNVGTQRLQLNALGDFQFVAEVVLMCQKYPVFESEISYGLGIVFGHTGTTAPVKYGANALCSALASLKKSHELLKQTLEAVEVTQMAKRLDQLKEMDTVYCIAKAYAATLQDKDYQALAEEFETYETMRARLQKDLASWSHVDVSLWGNPKLATPVIADQQAFYAAESKTLAPLYHLNDIERHVDKTASELETLKKLAEVKWVDEIGKVGGEVTRQMGDIAQHGCTEETYQEIDIWSSNLRCIAEAFGPGKIKQAADSEFSKLKAVLQKRLKSIDDELAVPAHDCLEDAAVARVGELFLNLKEASLFAPVFKTFLDDTIDAALNRYTSGKKWIDHGPALLGKLGLHLNAHDKSTIAGLLIAEHAAFKGYSLFLRNEATKACKIENVLDDMRVSSSSDVPGEPGEGFDRKRFETLHKAFDDRWWRLVEEGLHEPNQKALDDVLVSWRRKRPATGAEAGASADEVVIMMAHFFAYWTLSHAEHYRNNAKSTSPGAEDCHEEAPGRSSYLMQPHAAQLVSIFRLLGLDQNTTTSSPVKDPTRGVTGWMQNHLIEIKTGEGKSVTLAITAAVLATLGFHVDCACYSEYLSDRDYKAFEPMFCAFGLEKHIQYGTFNKLCEDFINQEGAIRTLVANAVKNTSSERPPEASHSGRPRALLIDEVDVFFSKDFYGSAYNPITTISHPSVSDLIHHIWDSKARGDRSALRLGAVQKTEAYGACKALLKDKRLLDECVKGMISDLNTYETTMYEVSDDGRIGHKMQDGISYNLSYFYKTMWIHFKEAEADRVSVEQRRAKEQLLIRSGQYSYAEIPKEYVSVMGVTGTLESLTNGQKETLKNEYNIEVNTFMESVYGRNQLQFYGDTSSATTGVRLETKSTIHTTLVEDVIKPILAKERAVLIFFPTTTALREFQQHSSMNQYKGFTKVLNENTAPDEKENLIRQATTRKSITLLTREFGRGTDFVCFDRQMQSEQVGGIHVCTTFLPEQISEEIQIRGRTARQGNRGSFSIVIDEEDLEPVFGKDYQDVISTMRASKQFYSVMDQRRNQRFDEELYPDSVKDCALIREHHAESQQFLTLLRGSSNAAELQEFLINENLVHIGSKVGRVLVLMDATGSMSSSLTKCKQCVGDMFQNAYQVLQEDGYGDFEIQMQYACYRNYNSSAEKLLQHSPWQSDANGMRAFLDTIGVDGGCGNEAVEIALWYANKVAEECESEDLPLSQVVLIGDMPPNTPSEVQEKRERRGDSYWSRFPDFAEPTTIDEQLAVFRETGIPVHCFFVDGIAAQEAFTFIAQNTGDPDDEKRTSVCQPLDIDSSAGAQELTKAVARTICVNIGGAELGAKYDEKFGFT